MNVPRFGIYGTWKRANIIEIRQSEDMLIYFKKWGKFCVNSGIFAFSTEYSHATSSWIKIYSPEKRKNWRIESREHITYYVENIGDT